MRAHHPADVEEALDAPGAVDGHAGDRAAEAGHEVTVVAGNLDYNTGHVPEKYRGRWTLDEQDGPVHVVRCSVPRTYASSYLGRMWAFAGFTLSAWRQRARVHFCRAVRGCISACSPRGTKP